MTCEWLFVHQLRLLTDHAQLRPHCTQNNALLTPIARAYHQHTKVDALFETAAEGRRTPGCSRVCLGGRLVIREIKTAGKHRRPLQTSGTDRRQRADLFCSLYSSGVRLFIRCDEK